MYPEQYPTAQAETGGSLAGAAKIRVANPTLRENIDAKIQWHKDEIERLGNIKDKMNFMLDVNLRDLREAMNF